MVKIQWQIFLNWKMKIENDFENTVDMRNVCGLSIKQGLYINYRCGDKDYKI